MRSAICISGLARTYKKTYDSFMRNVVGPLKERGDVDIFISIWDTMDIAALSQRTAEESKVDVNEIIRLYEPKAIDVEDFSSVSEAFKLDRLVTHTGGTPANGVIKNGTLTAAPAQYKVMRCNKLKCVHEHMNGFVYDLVVRTRFDMEITSLRLNEIDLGKVNCLYDHGDKVGDYFYIANSGNMDMVASLFVDYPTLLSVVGTDMGPERNLKNHMLKCGLDSHILTGYTFALVRNTFRQEYRWKASVSGYEPYTSMIICSALYYPGSILNGDLMVREDRFLPGKCSETFPVWYQYLRKHYPDDHLVLFCDTASPIPVQSLLDKLPEPYDTFTGYNLSFSFKGPLIHVKWLSEHAGKYFWPIQRNFVEGFLTAYHSGQNMFWADNDMFLNTDLRPMIRDADVMSSGIQHHQQTFSSVCFYISSRRFHALDELGIDLAGYLTNMVATGPENTRMTALQEGGLYKTFGYGDMREMTHINMSHLSCYPRFIQFLKANPLDTPEYRTLLLALETFDISRLPQGINLTFPDMLHSEVEGLIP